VHLWHDGGRFSQAELAEIHNFLVLQYKPPLGSVVHATPLFEALKRAVPDCHKLAGLLAQCDLIVGLDTVARTIGLPCVVIAPV
jgi:ADP-heptose:LPS heptosyltransferase